MTPLFVNPAVVILRVNSMSSRFLRSNLTSFGFSDLLEWGRFRPLHLDLHTRKEGEAKVGVRMETNMMTFENP